MKASWSCYTDDGTDADDETGSDTMDFEAFWADDAPSWSDRGATGPDASLAAVMRLFDEVEWSDDGETYFDLMIGEQDPDLQLEVTGTHSEGFTVVMELPDTEWQTRSRHPLSRVRSVVERVAQGDQDWREALDFVSTKPNEAGPPGDAPKTNEAPPNPGAAYTDTPLSHRLVLILIVLVLMSLLGSLLLVE